MKRITSLISLCILVAFGVTAQINTPQPSSSGSVESKIGLTDVSIEYFRPKKKGRKIFGEGNDSLVPYGQIWRTGANSGSILTVSTDVEIGGKDVKAGKYQILTIPGASEWSVIFHTEMIGGHMSNYDEDKVATIVKVKPSKLNTVVETMTFQLSDIKEDNTSANINLTWDNVSIKVPVTVDFHQTVMKDITNKTQVNPKNYVDAATYYMTTGENLEQSLKWMNKYLAVGENSEQFWNVHVKAQILAKMGEKKKAITVAKESLEKAKKNPNGDFGYIKRNEDLISSLK